MGNIRDCRQAVAALTSVVVVLAVIPVVLGRYNHVIKMGLSAHCDNAKTNAKIDWDENDSTPYTCNLDTRALPIKSNRKCPFSTAELERTAKRGICQNEKLRGFHHVCMNHTIEYDVPYPASGRHRPVWPEYAIYKYAPPQRWLHNLEHGGIVGLYHPCAPQKAVNDFINALACAVKNENRNQKNKLPMFVVTPEVKIPPCQPFVLLAWMHRLLMTEVLHDRIEDFVHKYYRKGPEDNTSEGQYKIGLRIHSKNVPCDD